MSLSNKYRNSILDSIPAHELDALSADLKEVFLEKDTVLFQPGRKSESIYFPTTAVVSFMGDTGEGGSIEVWAAGNEGIAGIFGVLGKSKPFRGVVQVSGNAFVGNSASFRRHFQKGEAFHDALLDYYDFLIVQVSYLGICNNLHSIDQRLSRWLLMLHDRAGTSELKFTQDSIAAAMGTRRATISVAAAALQKARVISYTPGSIRIESRKRLLAAACRCYRLINGR